MIALLIIFVFVGSGFGFIWKVGIYIDLGKMQPHGKFVVVPAHVIQILVVFQVVLCLVVVEGVSPRLGLGTALGARPFDGDLGRRSGR
jgi:hypothetical protein